MPTADQWRRAQDILAFTPDGQERSARLAFVAPCTESIALEAVAGGLDAVAHVLNEAALASGTLTHSRYLANARDLARDLALVVEILRGPSAERETLIQDAINRAERDRAQLQVIVPVPTLLEPSDFARATRLIAGDTEPKAPTLWDHLLEDGLR